MNRSIFCEIVFIYKIRNKKQKNLGKFFNEPPNQQQDFNESCQFFFCCCCSILIKSFSISLIFLLTLFFHINVVILNNLSFFLFSFLDFFLVSILIHLIFFSFSKKNWKKMINESIYNSPS